MPTLVVGPGRCGTSTVTQMISDQGIFIGAGLIPGDESNPNGHFEDIDFRNLNQQRLQGSITPEDWEHGVRHLAAMRSEPWGFKDPRTAHFVDEYRQILDPSFIRCRRKKEHIVASMSKWYGWSEKRATETIELREGMLDFHLASAEVLEITIDDLIAGVAKDKIGDFIHG